MNIETAIQSHKLSDLAKKEKAVELILEFGWIDGAHHKDWVLDQVLQTLLGSSYVKILTEELGDPEEWDQGIAP